MVGLASLWLRLLLLSFCFLKAWPSPSSYHCPKGCSCLSTQGTKLKLSCDWPSLSDSGIFSTFPVNRTVSLSVRCHPHRATSKLLAGTFRHLNALRHLTLHDCHKGDRSLQEGLFIGLRELRTLELHLSSRASSPPLDIHKGAFLGIKRLEKLQLYGNKLASLPTNELCSLRELKWLNLSNNHFKDFDSIGLGSSCRHASQLIMLDLSHNLISAIPANSFAHLSNVRFLHLNHNHISTVQPNAFSGLSNLRKLILERNQISIFPEDSALPQGTLKVLDLSGNQISNIPRLVPIGGVLTRLNLSHNAISSLEPKSFGLPSLRAVDVSFNKLRSLPANVFDNLTMLTFADFSHNRIGKIARFTFRDLRSLEVIHLNDNNLKDLDHSSFYHLENLKQINLANNTIENLSSQFFSGMARISQLDLSNNRLRRVPTSVSGLYYLQQLLLSHNQIQQLQSGTFDPLPNLRVADFSWNKLARINRYCFENLAKLEHLDLSHNLIATLADNCFHKDDMLSKLFLQNNALTSFGTVLSRLPNLELLNASFNGLTQLDASMIPTSLKVLMAAYNKISTISNSQRKTLSLHELDISHNLLETLDVSVFIVPQIRKINLSHNHIEDASAGLFDQKPALQMVDLRHNRIRRLNVSSISLPDTHLLPAQLYLAGNPFLCNCEMGWLKGRQFSGSGQHNLPSVLDLSAVTCTPLLQSYRPPQLVDHVPSSEFLCRYDIVCSKDDCLCCDYESCDCKSVCPPGCSCYRDAKFSRNVVKCTNNTHFGQGSPDQISITSVPMLATEIFLDGTHLEALKRHDFLARFRLRKLYLNGSNINSIEPKTFTGLRSLEVLDLSHNAITILTGLEFYNVPKLMHLDLSWNRLTEIQPGTLSSMHNLRHLNINNNRLQRLPETIAHASPTLSAIRIAMNPWLCDCNDRYLIQRWLPENSAKILDNATVYCRENFSDPLTTTSPNGSTSVLAMLPLSPDNTVKVNFWTFRSEVVPNFCFKTNLFPTEYPNHSFANSNNVTLVLEEHSYGLFAIGGACTFVTLVIVGLIIWRFRMLIKHRLAATTHKPFMASLPVMDLSPVGSSSDPFLQYDAFVCYSIEDKEMVRESITSKLEEESPYYELRLLYRDILTGPYTNRHVISDEIISSMEKSQRILLILTANFLGLEWRLAQIRTALQCVLKDPRRRKLIVILTDEVPLHEIDTMLGHYIRTNVCFSCSDPLFWEKLREAMPDKAPNSPLNRTSSTEIYGTIVPSDFV